MTKHSNSTLIQAVEQLILCINPHMQDAKMQIAALHLEIQKYQQSDLNPYALMLMFKEVTQWKSSYYTDWKDADSLVAAINQLASLWQVNINWTLGQSSEKNGLYKPDVHLLLDHVHPQFLASELRLWGWDTSGEDYGGWVARVKHDDEIAAIANTLAIDFMPECTGYSVDQVEQMRGSKEHWSHASNLQMIQYAVEHFKQNMAETDFKTKVRISWGFLKFLLLITLLMPLILIFKGLLKFVSLLQSKKN